MPEKKVKVTLPGIGTVDGSEVSVTESVDRWSEIKLDDGTVLRIKPLVISVTRVDGRYDPQGNPMYAVQGTQTMIVGSAPEHLRQGAQQSKIH